MTVGLMADLSHWNGTVDLTKYTRRRIGLKATDGANTIDPEYLTRVKAAHKRTVRRIFRRVAVEHYHFGEPGDAKAQAEFFVATVAEHWVKGDRVVIDAETNGVDGPFVANFIATVHDLKPGWQGLIYGSPYFLRSNNIMSTFKWLLWLAEYAAAWAFIPPGFNDHVDQWQYTRTGHCTGISGACDMSKIYGAAKDKGAKAFGAAMRTAVKYVTRHYLARVRNHDILPAADAKLTDELVAAATKNKATT